MAPGLGGSSSWSASTFGLIFGLKAQDRARENENGKHSMMRGRSEASSRKQKSWIPEGLAKLEGEQKHPAQFGEVGKKQQSKISGQDGCEYPRRGRQTSHTPKNRPSGGKRQAYIRLRAGYESVSFPVWISILVDFDALHTRGPQVLGRRRVDELEDAIRGRRREGRLRGE